mgnify:CR=1 FL=1
MLDVSKRQYYRIRRRYQIVDRPLQTGQNSLGDKLKLMSIFR